MNDIPETKMPKENIILTKKSQKGNCSRPHRTDRKLDGARAQPVGGEGEEGNCGPESLMRSRTPGKWDSLAHGELVRLKTAGGSRRFFWWEHEGLTISCPICLMSQSRKTGEVRTWTLSK